MKNYVEKLWNGVKYSWWVALINTGKPLSKKVQLNITEHPKAEELIRAYVVRHTPCAELQVRMLGRPEALDLLKILIAKKKQLCSDAVDVLFEKPDELLKQYIQEYRLDYSKERKLLQLPNPYYWIKLYTQRHQLNCPQVLFELENPYEILEDYISKYALDKCCQDKLLERYGEDKLILKYLEKWGGSGNAFSDKMQLALFASSASLVSEHIKKHALCDVAQQRMMHLNNVEELISIYVNEHGLICNSALKTLFETPNGKTLLLKYCLLLGDKLRQKETWEFRAWWRTL